MAGARSGARIRGRGAFRRGLPATVGLALGAVVLPPSGWAQERVVASPSVRVSSERAEVVQVEATIAVDPADPSRMVVAAIGLRRPRVPDWQDHQTVFVYGSRDGGASWSHRPLPGLPRSWTAGDPWLAWTRGDTVLLSAIAGAAITRRAEPPAVPRVWRSDDGGWTWSEGSTTPFPEGTDQDHPVLAVGEARSGGPVVYAAATRATSESEGVDLSRIVPGRTEAEPLPALRPALTGVNMGGAAVLPDGAPVVTYFSMRPPRPLHAARFDPDKQAWTESRIRASILPVGFPPLAADASDGRFAGRLHAVWVESRNQADLRVVAARSDDGGRSWSEPAPVHRDTSGVARTLPAVAVAPDGAVGVIWHDRRHAGGAACGDLYGAISVDGGRSFLPEVRISEETACPSVENDGAAANRFRIGGGDYQGLAPVGPGAFQAVWADSRTGRFQVWTARFEAR